MLNFAYFGGHFDFQNGDCVIRVLLHIDIELAIDPLPQ